MELVNPVITPVVESLMGVVKRHLGFCFYSTNNVRDMRARIEQLYHTARDMKTRKETNDANNLVVPHHVPSWLAQVETICEEAGNVPTGGIGCFNMKSRYKAGKRSSDIIKKIGDLEDEQSRITWGDEQRPLGRVHSTLPSTSEPVVVAAANDDDDGIQTGLKSRDLIFKEAMKSLDPNNKTQKIALCGMGGVGKTTMMDQLKKVADDKKMFDWIVKVVIGKSENLIAIQQTIAEYIGQPLTEIQKDTRAERLRKRFVGMSEDGKKNILVILDDLWEEVDLKDIGLTNPLPKGFKLLLTSREEHVCTRMGVEASSIFGLAVLEEPEAKKLFWEIVGTVSDGNINHDLHKIGEDIVTKCGGLPIAIKTIASTLRDNSVKHVWVDVLERLQNKELPFVETIFKTSYENIKDGDEKATFLLSGLFPDDYNIPIEDLMRYGCGLKLFKTSKTISTARRQVNTCVHNLVRSNMLIESDRKGCVKMHDLVRDFVLRNFSNVKQASLVKSEDMSEQLTEESYERILLKCTGMRDFPADFNHPNLALLKLLDGDKLRTFPEDFYDRMEKLEVVAYDRIRQPLLPRYLTTLRTLCLSLCTSVGDISFIGDLINLEVLSFVFCGISKLPSAIGNLKKLKLLDLTGCLDLCIDDGVFHKLEKLRELYMRAVDGRPIRFTEDSCEGLKKLSSKLIALDVEFFESIIQPKNLSFEKLERFRISMGCPLEYSNQNGDAYENMLKLVVSCKEVLECKINKLFEKTEILDLSVNEMSSLEEISMHPSQGSFCNLRVLYVHKCADLTSIFTVNVASSLTNLERLYVSKCPVLEYLVQGDNSEAKSFKFHKLKFLHLFDLPMFVSLCDTDQVMELRQLVKLQLYDLSNFTSIFSENNEISATRQPLLNKKIVIPNLESLFIVRMEKLKEILSCENTSIHVTSSLTKLEFLGVCSCPKLESLVQGENSEAKVIKFHKLKSLRLDKLPMFVSLCDTDQVMELPQLMYLKLTSLPNFTSIFSGNNEISATTRPLLNKKIVTPNLERLEIRLMEKLKEIWSSENTTSISEEDVNNSSMLRKIEVYECDSLVNIFPCNPMRLLSHLAVINGQKQQILIPNLEELRILWMKKLREIFSCENTSINVASSLTKLESLGVHQCPVLESLVQGENSEAKVIKFHKLKLLTLKYLPMFVSLCDTHQVMELPQLVTLTLWNLPNVTSIFSVNNEISATTQPLLNKKIVTPNLERLDIRSLEKLKEIWSSENTSISEEDVNNSSMLRKIEVYECDSLVNIFPCNPMRLLSHLAVINGKKQQPLSLFHNLTTINLGLCKSIKYLFSPITATHLSNLKEVSIWNCDGMEEVVSNRDENEDEQMTAPTTTTLFPHLDQLSLSSLPSLKHVDGCVAKGTNNDINDQLKYYQVPVVCWSLCQYSRKIFVQNCNSLEHIFTFSTLESLTKVEEISISKCNEMKVIVREENGEQTVTSKVVVFPRLKSIRLGNLPNLEGFFLGMSEFKWPLLDDVKIIRCPKVMAFTSSKSTAPKLKSIHLTFGTYSPKCHNFYVTTNSPQTPSPSVENGPLFLQDTIEVNLEDNNFVEEIFASNELLQLPNLEKIHVKRCGGVKTVFEVESEVTDSELNSKSQTVVKFPKLREVDLELLHNLYFLWKSNFHGVKLEFPNLTRVSIHKCKRLEHVFTSSMVGSLMQLHDLHITKCYTMEVIIKDEKDEEKTEEECDGDGKVSEIIVFPCLKSLKLENLGRYFKGFYLGKDLDFSLPSLDAVVIKRCPYLEVFTKGRVAAPLLKVIETGLGLTDVGEQDINSFIITKKQEEELHFAAVEDSPF